jgi:hypothetical protein
LAAVTALQNGAVADNTAAIAKLNGDANTVGSVDYKVAQEVAKILDDSDPDDIDTLNEIAAWITNDTTGAAKMNADIVANTTAINLINTTTIPNAVKEAKDYTDAEIAKVDLAGTLQSAKDYTDAQIPAALAAYKVKDVDNTTLQLSETGVASVKAVSTDLLIQGTEELVLNGGSAV